MSLFRKRKDAEPPYEMDEELARRIAMRAYVDEDHDGEPDIPAAQFPG